MSDIDQGSDIAEDESDDAFDLDELDNKKQQKDDTPTDDSDDFDFDAIDNGKKSNKTEKNDNPKQDTKPKQEPKKETKQKRSRIIDSDDDDDDATPQFVNWKMKDKAQRQQRPKQTQTQQNNDIDDTLTLNNDDDDDDDGVPVKRYDTDSSEDSRERSQYHNYYDFDLDESDTKKDHKLNTKAPIYDAPITPFDDTEYQKREQPKSGKTPLFSTYIEPLQEADEPTQSNQPKKEYTDIDVIEEKQPSKYDETPPKSDKKPLFSSYVEPLQDAPQTTQSNEAPNTYQDIDEKQPSKHDEAPNTYQDIDEKQPSKYEEAPSKYDEPPPKSDKEPLLSTYVEPLQDPDEAPPSNEAPNNYQQPSKYDENRKPISVDEFKSVSLGAIFESDDTLRDHYDIAKKICKYFDDKFGDKNSVCVVSEPEKQPAISYWVNGDYVRKERNVNGKDILIYRACSHKEAKKPIVSNQAFRDYVERISNEYKDSSVDRIADLMDDRFGKGCHYARSKQRKPEYDIYSRFTDKYDADFRLPSGAYVIAWRR